MNDKKRLNSYEDLPLVLDVADIQRIMGISRASAYELVPVSYTHLADIWVLQYPYQQK